MMWLCAFVRVKTHIKDKETGKYNESKSFVDMCNDDGTGLRCIGRWQADG